MNKKLPKVFVNKVNKSGNNENVFYSNNKEKTSSNFGKNINQKISEIFKSSNYVYKALVEIVLKDKTIVKQIIGKNKNNLITMENELIPITDIIDIKIKK